MTLIFENYGLPRGHRRILQMEPFGFEYWVGTMNYGTQLMAVYTDSQGNRAVTLPGWIVMT